MPQDDQQTIWACRASESIVDGLVTASEHLPLVERSALLREIARRALWNMPNPRDEIRELAKYFGIENVRKPHPEDDLPDDLPGG